MYSTELNSPLGPLLLCADGNTITGICLPGTSQRAFLSSVVPWESLQVFRESELWLRRYFSGENPGTPPALSPSGSAFQAAVWSLLAQIPYGRSVTYGQLSQQLIKNGIPSSSQAVGGAVKRNPIPLFLPCHRVLGRGNTLTGYSGGLAVKRFLLDLEGIPYH